MTAGDAILLVGLTLLGFVVSALFSGLETGLYTLNPIRLALRATRGEPSALRLRRELGRSTRTLAVILIGTNAANYLGSFASAELLAGLGLEGWWLVIVTALLVTPLLFVFAETLPKELFRTHSDHWTYWLSSTLVGARWLMTVTLLLPLVQLMTLPLGQAERLSARQRVSRLIKEGVGAGVLSVSQTTVADRALALRDRRIAPLIIPWSSVVKLADDADRTTRERLVRQRNFSRLPVVDRRGAAIGVVTWVDAVLNPDRPTRELVREAIVLEPRTLVLDALSEMRRRHQRLAIVASPGSIRPLGIVTLKDLVEPMTGELAAW